MTGAWVLIRMKPKPRRETHELAPHQGDATTPPAPAPAPPCSTPIPASRRAARIDQVAAGLPVVKARPVPPAPFRRPTPASAAAAAHPGQSRPGFIPPQLCTSADRAPTGPGWVHELKLDGYRMQAHVDRRQGPPADPQRPGLDRPLPRRRERPRPPARLRHRRRALRARCRAQARLRRPAGRHRARHARARWCSSPSTCCCKAARTCARCRSERKEALADAARPAAGRRALPRAFRRRRRGRAAIGLPARAGRRRLEEGRPPPTPSGRGPAWVKAKCRGRDEFVDRRLGPRRRAAASSLLLGAMRDGELVYLGRVGSGIGGCRGGRLDRSPTARRRAKSPFSTTTERRGRLGRAPCWSPRSSTRASPATARSARAPSRPCARTSPRPRSDPHRRPNRQHQARHAEPASPTKPTVVRPKTPGLTHPDKLLWPERRRHQAGPGRPITQPSRPRLLVLYRGPRRSRSSARPTASPGSTSSSATPCAASPRSSTRSQVRSEKQPYLMVDSPPKAWPRWRRSRRLEIHPWGAPPPISSGPTAWCSTSTPPPTSPSPASSRAPSRPRPPGRAGPGQLLQDHRRQGPACRRAARSAARRMARGQGLRQVPLRAHVRRRARPLPRRDVQEGPHRPHLPRLPPQRPHQHRRRRLVPPRPPRRPRLACRSPGRRSPPSSTRAYTHPHRPSASRQEGPVEGLERCGFTAPTRPVTPGPRDFSRPTSIGKKR